MNRRVILTVDGRSYLIPEDQAKDLTKLLTDISAWQPVEKPSYKSGWTLKPEVPQPEIGLAMVAQDSIDDGKPRAAATT